MHTHEMTVHRAMMRCESHKRLLVGVFARIKQTALAIVLFGVCVKWGPYPDTHLRNALTS